MTESRPLNEQGTGGASTRYADRYPVAEIDRPFALLPMVLEPEAKLILDFWSGDGAENSVALGTGAGFGIVKNLEAGLTFPVRIAPTVKAGDFDFYGLYDLTPMLGRGLSLAGRVDMVIPASTSYSYSFGADFLLLASGHLKYKIIPMLAALADVGLGAGFFDGPNAFLFFFDFGVLVQAIEPLAFTLTSGFHVFANRDWTTVPLRLRGQYTVAGNLDVFLEMAFPDLNNAKADYFQLIGGAAFRIGM